MITSKQNALVKKIRSLDNKKYRDEYNEYIVEGITMVKEAVKSNMPVSSIVCTEKWQEQISKLYENYEVVSDEVMEYITSQVSPQGVIAVLRKPKNELAEPKSNALFLDGLTDPTNVGAIIRTAAASGFCDVYLASSADAFNPKSVRASMSGIFKVRLHIGDREELLNKINIPIIIADMGGKEVKDFKIDANFCLTIGNESRGVSKELKDRADYIVSLKMDNDMESLNASVSASILMYALSKKV